MTPHGPWEWEAQSCPGMSCTGMGEPGLGGEGRETESPEKVRTPRAGLWFVAADDEQHFDQP